MRVLLAGLFVYGGMLGLAGLSIALFGEQDPPWYLWPLMGVAMLALFVIAAIVFNSAGYRPGWPGRSQEQIIADYEAQGMLLRERFEAKRTFAVEQFEDEGSTYYVELIDGRVLFLTGQYLYRYEPITDDGDGNQARAFPCTEFEVLRHRKAGHVLKIECGGTVLEPEAVAGWFTDEDYQRGVPEDGDIIAARTYDDLKRECLRGTP